MDSTLPSPLSCLSCYGPLTATHNPLVGSGYWKRPYNGKFKQLSGEQRVAARLLGCADGEAWGEFDFPSQVDLPWNELSADQTAAASLLGYRRIPL